jgi:hypothetical protein
LNRRTATTIPTTFINEESGKQLDLVSRSLVFMLAIAFDRMATDAGVCDAHAVAYSMVVSI